MWKFLKLISEELSSRSSLYRGKPPLPPTPTDHKEIQSGSGKSFSFPMSRFYSPFKPNDEFTPRPTQVTAVTEIEADIAYSDVARVIDVINAHASFAWRQQGLFPEHIQTHAEWIQARYRYLKWTGDGRIENMDGWKPMQLARIDYAFLMLNNLPLSTLRTE